jgi:hypothetical protein
VSRLGDYLEYKPEQDETIEATLAFILIDLEGLSKQSRFTMEQEDQLLEIERKAKMLRSQS